MLLPLCVSCEKSKPCDIYLSIMQISVYMEVGVVNLRCLRQQIKAVCNPKCSIQFRKLGTDSFSISISQLWMAMCWLLVSRRLPGLVIWDLTEVWTLLMLQWGILSGRSKLEPLLLKTTVWNLGPLKNQGPEHCIAALSCQFKSSSMLR